MSISRRQMIQGMIAGLVLGAAPKTQAAGFFVTPVIKPPRLKAGDGGVRKI